MIAFPQALQNDLPIESKSTQPKIIFVGARLIFALILNIKIEFLRILITQHLRRNAPDTRARCKSALSLQEV